MKPASPFYLPPRGLVGDVIPFASEGKAWLFYLHEFREDPKPGTPWDLLVTKDFITFEERGTAIASGTLDDQDFNAYTGSVVEHEGTHYLFYTAHNPTVLGDDGIPLQRVAIATSTDGMQTWTKHPELTFGAPEGYETGDWRDPFVFRESDDQPWRMLVTARTAEGPERRRGVIAQMRSDDLLTWRADEPFYAPERYVAHECPEVFEWNGWWYLVYSEFTDAFVTRYRMSTSPTGPWVAPEFDSVDGRAFYASKSVMVDGSRYFVGWIATKEDEKDDGAYQWAGTLSTVQATQREDGTLDFSIPTPARELMSQSRDVSFDGRIGEVTVDGTGRFAVAVSDEPQKSGPYRLSATIEFGPDVETCGLMFNASADADEHYALRLEPRRGRLVFDRWPRKVTGHWQWQVSGDVPHSIELERPCRLDPGVHTLDVIVDDTTFVACLDGAVTLSARIYDRREGHVGLFATEGSAVFRDVTISTTVLD